jgi:hypothetical protein
MPLRSLLLTVAASTSAPADMVAKRVCIEEPPLKVLAEAEWCAGRRPEARLGRLPTLRFGSAIEAVGQPSAGGARGCQAGRLAGKISWARPKFSNDGRRPRPAGYP